MDTQQFIQDFREAFGQKVDLPLLFGYSDNPAYKQHGMAYR